MNLQLQIVTPDRTAFEGEVEMVSLFGAEGSFGVFPGHTPFMAELQIAPLSFRQNGQDQLMAVMGGFAEVLPHSVRIVTRAAERDTEIEPLRAQEAKKRAEAALTERREAIDIVRAEAALQRALIRLKLSGKARPH